MSSAIMPPFISDISKVKLKVLGWYQVIGGVMGVLLTLWLLLYAGKSMGLLALLYVVAFGLYAYSSHCGRLLLAGDYVKGLKLSLINQAVQIISFSAFGYGFMYISGVMLAGEVGKTPGTAGYNMGFHFFPFSQWMLFLNTNYKPMEISVNFVAIFLVYFSYKLNKTIMAEKVAFEAGQRAQAIPAAPAE
jgi:hypothetical protein